MLMTISLTKPCINAITAWYDSEALGLGICSHFQLKSLLCEDGAGTITPYLSQSVARKVDVVAVHVYPMHAGFALKSEPIAICLHTPAVTVLNVLHGC